MKAHIDFETKSEVDLKKQGNAVYAAHPSTDILCMGWAIENDPVEIWIPGMPFPFELAMHIAEGGDIYAHNAPFEWIIWNTIGVSKHGWEPLKIEQTFCNLAMALTQGFPGKLEKLAPAMKLEVEKDMAGNRAMLQLSKPRKICKETGAVTWWEKSEFPEKFEALYNYCKMDVEVERAAGKKLKPLSPSERNIWILDHRINQRGIAIDRESVKVAEELIESEKARLDSEMRVVTDGKVSSCAAAAQIGNYLREKGLVLDGVTKGEVSSLLALSNLPEQCRAVLELRQQAAKSSTAKLAAMGLRMSNDGRVRNTAQYHGAGTGRWAGRGIQLQNLPRPSIKQQEIDRAFELFHQMDSAAMIEILIGSPMNVISDCIRGFLWASEGKELLVSDWANIEGRILAWLAGETWKVKAFEEFDTILGYDQKGDPIRKGPDLYLLSYSTSFYVPIEKVTKDERQIGKVTELSMGYQGGVGAFQSMAKNYGVKVSDARANEIKLAWRAAHPAIVKYWYALEEAAVNAVMHPGMVYKVRSIAYRREGDFLMCRLPSGRILYYPYPQLEESRFGKTAVTYMGEDSTTKQWKRQHFYGGLAAENITQAVAADILRFAIINLEERGYPVVFHVHDEIIVEKEISTGSVKEMEQIMCELPAWAIGLPLAAEGFKSKRYRK